MIDILLTSPKIRSLLSFSSRVICKSVSPKFIELFMETSYLCPSEGHKYGGREVTETSVAECCY